MENTGFTSPVNDGADAAITAESIFVVTKQELSELFSYNRIGREFTGDISIIRDRVRRTISGTPAETLGVIADSHMSEVRRKFSQINDNIDDRNWNAIDDFMKNALPAAIVSFFFNHVLASEVKDILNRLATLSEKRWDKTRFLGKALVPSAKFEDVYALRYITSNIRF